MQNRTITMQVKATLDKTHKPRLYIAGLLIKLAEKISKTTIHVEIKEV